MKDFRPCLKALVRTFRPIRWKAYVSVLIGLVSIASSLAFVWISKYVVDIATGAKAADLMTGVWAMAGIMALQILCRVAAAYWEGYVLVKSRNNIRAGIFEKTMRSTWDGQEKLHSGDTVNRLEEDVRVISEFLCVNLPDCMVTVCQFIAATIFLFKLSPELGWILIFIMPVAVVGSRLFFRKMRALTTEIRAVDSRIQGHMQENLQHRILAKVLGSTARVMEIFGGMQKEVQDKTVKRLNYGAIARGFMNLGFSAGYLTAFLWGVFGLRDGTVTYGLMVAFLQLVSQVQRPVADITRHIPAFIRTLASEERIMELEEMPQEEDVAPIMLDGAPGIRISGLQFTYPGSTTTVIDSLDFDFKPGTMTVVEGATGAGKSTLIRLAMALLQPSVGSITLYTDKEEHVSDTGTRCNFMYVPQGNSLMSGTIRSNLQMACTDATDEQMKDALKLACAEFVLDLPSGLDTQCSEVGGGLSEGQAQRIAIARALLRPGGILVMDEASSALDAATEKELLSRLSERFRGPEASDRKTIICITHRPEAAKYADAVLDFSKLK